MELFRKERLNFIPYVIIFLLSLISCYIIFIPGTNLGDDFYYHAANIVDEIETIINNHELNPISGNLISGFGIGNRLFYSPFSHLFVTYLYLFLKNFGATIIGALELAIFISIFISGLIMYRFGLKLSNKKRFIGLIVAAIYILYPYRIFDAFCRFALAETMSFIFLPLFFMGLYDLVHLEKLKFCPFVEIIIGGAMLYLTHNITAIFAYTFGILYLLANIKKMTKILKNKLVLITCFASVFLLLGLCSISWISQAQLLNTNIYNVCIPSRMATDPFTVSNRTGEQLSYSGFLNVPYLSGIYPNYFSWSSLLTNVLLFIIISTIFIVLDLGLAKIKKLDLFHSLISVVIYFLLLSFCQSRDEIYFGGIIIVLIYLFIYYVKENNYQDNKKRPSIFSSVTFWFSVGIIIICIDLMQSADIWLHLPSIFLNIQFPWRLWAFVQLFAAILVGVIAKYVKNQKYFSFGVAIIAGLLLVTNQTLLQKRFEYFISADTSWNSEIDRDNLLRREAIGWNLEYIPEVFVLNDYQSIYSGKTLYYQVKQVIHNGPSGENYQVKPAVLNGNATITVSSAYAPIYDLTITASSESIIQMPLIYYPGYEVKLLDLETNESTKINVENIDGLVAYTVSPGNYQVTTNYPGTTLRKISFVWFYTALIIMLEFGLMWYVYPNIKRKKLF